MCINGCCSERHPIIKKNPTHCLKVPLDYVPYASKHIQLRGKKMHVACFPKCKFRSTLALKKSLSAERCCLPRCVQLHLESKTLAFLGLLFPWASRGSATCLYTLIYVSGQGNTCIPGCGVVSLMAVAVGGAHYLSMHSSLSYCTRHWPSSVLVR